MSLIEKEMFIKNTPRGSEFGKSMAETGVHCEDGTVIWNSCGQAYYAYKSIEDYADSEFLNKEVVCLKSEYVGDRDQEGNITWFNGSYDASEVDQDEDGNNVYTLPRLFASVEPQLLNDINQADAFDLLEMVLKRPDLVQDELTLELLSRRNAELAAYG
jgi:hypothetical protein